jgi:hypothetical protein
MEARVAKLEDFADDTRERLARIETRLEETATKADLGALRVEMHKGFADIIKWMVGLTIVISATAVTIMTFVLNNATPKAPPAPPVIIYAQPAPPPK